MVGVECIVTHGPPTVLINKNQFWNPFFSLEYLRKGLKIILYHIMQSKYLLLSPKQIFILPFLQNYIHTVFFCRGQSRLF
jgi:hypothetical protein